MTIGKFNEADARTIAEYVGRRKNEPFNDAARHRRRVLPGGGGAKFGADFKLLTDLAGTTASAEIIESWPRDRVGESITVYNIETPRGVRWSRAAGTRGRAYFDSVNERWAIVEMADPVPTYERGCHNDIFLPGTTPKTLVFETLGFSDLGCTDCAAVMDRQVDLEQQPGCRYWLNNNDLSGGCARWLKCGVEIFALFVGPGQINGWIDEAPPYFRYDFITVTNRGLDGATFDKTLVYRDQYAADCHAGVSSVRIRTKYT